MNQEREYSSFLLSFERNHLDIDSTIEALLPIPNSLIDNNSSHEIFENKLSIDRKENQIKYFFIRKVIKKIGSQNFNDFSDINDESIYDEKNQKLFLKLLSNQQKIVRMRKLSREVKKYKTIVENFKRKFKSKIHQSLRKKLNEPLKINNQTIQTSSRKNINIRTIIKAYKNQDSFDNRAFLNCLINNIIEGNDEFIRSNDFKKIVQETRYLICRKKFKKQKILNSSDIKKDSEEISKSGGLINNYIINDLQLINKEIYINGPENYNENLDGLIIDPFSISFDVK